MLDGDALQSLQLRTGCVFAVILELNSSQITAAWFYAILPASQLVFLAHQ